MLLVGWLVLIGFEICWLVVVGFGEVHFLILLYVDWYVLAAKLDNVFRYLLFFFCISWDLPSSILLFFLHGIGD